jgi:hypothetical protein
LGFDKDVKVSNALVPQVPDASIIPIAFDATKALAVPVSCNSHCSVKEHAKLDASGPWRVNAPTTKL